MRGMRPEATIPIPAPAPDPGTRGPAEDRRGPGAPERPASSS